ncbi:MAG: RDD family protein [Bacteroidota bacterium]|jgi:uncharacterized RDD family membrane protein YckC
MEEQLLDKSSLESFAPEYAGFWIRFAAAFIDGIILSIPQLAIQFAMGESASEFGAGFLLYYVIIISLNWIYYAGMESSSNQATLGKMVVGIKVTNLEGEPITFINATGRYFAKIISTIILLIGFIMAAFTPKKQALHDQLAKTLVIKK